MSALAKKIVKACEDLDKAIAYQAKAESDYATVKALNGQYGYAVSVNGDGYAVSVNGVRVDVAVMDQRTYMAAMIRGREMIHLGALKSLSAIITDAALNVAAHRRNVAGLAARMAESAMTDGDA